MHPPDKNGFYLSLLAIATFGATSTGFISWIWSGATTASITGIVYAGIFGTVIGMWSGLFARVAAKLMLAKADSSFAAHFVARTIAFVVGFIVSGIILTWFLFAFAQGMSALGDS